MANVARQRLKKKRTRLRPTSARQESGKRENGDYHSEDENENAYEIENTFENLAAGCELGGGRLSGRVNQQSGGDEQFNQYNHEIPVSTNRGRMA
jgi:hypothetical protein